MSTLHHVLFWRHAEAEDPAAEADATPGGSADLARALTRDGRRDASAMAAWIKAHVPKPWVVCASPALRTRQTALALVDYPVSDARLAPDAGADPILELIAEHRDQRGALVLCGHQPHLGQAALRWLAGADAAFSLRKGGLIWCIERQREGTSQRILRAALSPDLLD